MITQQQLDAVGYIIYNGLPRQLTYRDYLFENGSDELTTCSGWSSKYFIKEKALGLVYRSITADWLTISSDEYDELPADERNNYSVEEQVIYELRIWRTGGHSSELIRQYEDEQEAECALYEYRQSHVRDHNWNAPTFYDSISELIADVAEREDRTPAVIERYIAMKEWRRERDTRIAEEAHKENEEYKKRMAIEVPAEAATIVIDDDFKAALAWANEATGLEKNNRHASAMKGLLARNNIAKINSDFWQVFRLLKKKAETVVQ